MVQWVKNSPAVQETQEMWVQSLVWEDPLEEDLPHSSIPVWRSLVGYSTGGCKQANNKPAKASNMFP